VSDVSKYILKLSRLKVDRSHGAPAPHKAILLISVLQSILEGQNQDNRIAITPELVARFKDNWSSHYQSTSFPFHCTPSAVMLMR
jgi:putative restriction endonuclease